MRSDTNQDILLMSKKDYLRLSHLLKQEKNEDKLELEAEIESAELIDDEQIPATLVTMNSRVKYYDETLRKEKTITVVYPAQADSDHNKISILSPIGSALLGLKTGQCVSWKFPNGKTRKLKLLDVIYQPEASGDYQL